MIFYAWLITSVRTLNGSQFSSDFPWRAAGLVPSIGLLILVNERVVAEATEVSETTSIQATDEICKCKYIVR